MALPQDVKDILAGAVQKLGLREDVLPVFDVPEPWYVPCLQYADGLYHYVQTDERSIEYRRSTDDLNEFLFWIFLEITGSAAMTEAHDTSPKNQDIRRQAFSRQREMMAQINPVWEREIALMQDSELRDRPFDDEAHLREEYRAQVIVNGEAEKLARIMRLSNDSDPISSEMIEYYASRLVREKYPKE